MPDSKRDYYEVLGVSRDANAQDIKKSYRKLARTHHPDANPGDTGAEDRFKELTEAYEVLSNPESRRAYDTYGHQIPRGNGGYPGGGNPFGSGGGMQDIFEAFFGDSMGDTIFGGGRRGPARGRDAEVTVELELTEAAFGVERTVNVQIIKSCTRCDGTGGEKTQVCDSCSGAGRIRSVRNTMLGQMVTEQECPTCRGSGRRIEVPCEVCRGSGNISDVVERTVKIPAGIEEGMRLRVSGGGHHGEAGAPPGDLYINIRVKEDESLIRDGDDLIHHTRVSFVQASLGAEVTVPTLEGSTTVRVQSGTQPGTTMRLHGKGMPKLRGYGRGDLKVLVEVLVPTQVSSEQRELLERFESLSGDDTYNGGASFFDRLRGVFR